MLVLSELQLDEVKNSGLTKSDKKWVIRWVIKNSTMIVDEKRLNNNKENSNNVLDNVYDDIEEYINKQINKINKN